MASWRLGVLLVLLVTCATAAEPGVELRAEPAAVEVGESVTLHVVYRWREDRPPAAPPNPSTALDGEVITAIDGPRSTTAGGMVSQAWRLVLVMERSGTWAAPRFSLRLPGDGAPLRAPEVLIGVGTGGEPARLAPASALWVPAVDEPGRVAATWPWIVAGGTLLALLATLGWWLLRRRDEPPGLSPAERFARQLPAARAADDGKLAGALLSAALRRYCGERWAFDGVAATNAETVDHLRGGIPGEALADLRRLLDHLDGLRWSPQALAKASVQPLIDQAGTWVERQEQRLAREAERAREAAA